MRINLGHKGGDLFTTKHAFRGEWNENGEPCGSRCKWCGAWLKSNLSNAYERCYA